MDTHTHTHTYTHTYSHTSLESPLCAISEVKSIARVEGK